MKTTAVVEFAKTGGDGSGLKFALRQKAFKKKAPSGFEAWLHSQGVNTTIPSGFLLYDQYRSGCTSTGLLEVTLEVRLEDIEMPYVLRVSYGTLNPYGMLTTEYRREFLPFELSREQEVDFGLITNASWNGDVYNEDGDIIVPPTPVLSGGKVTLPEPCYGVLEVEVVEEFYSHRLLISPRAATLAQAESEDDISDELYASTAMLFCDKRIALLDVRKPDDFGTCRGTTGAPGYRTEFEDGEEEDGPEEQYWVTFEVFDYCTGKVIRNATVSVDGGTAAGVDSPVSLLAGEHTVRVTAPGYTPSHQDDLTENDRFTLGGSGG